jgi:hypothetical protein
MNNNHTYPRSLQPSEREPKTTNKLSVEPVEKPKYDCNHTFVPYEMSFVDYDDRFAKRGITQSVICVDCDLIKVVGVENKRDRIVNMNMINGSGGGAGGFGYTYKSESLGEKGRNGGDGGFGPTLTPSGGLRVTNPAYFSRINTVKNTRTIMSSNGFKTATLW